MGIIETQVDGSPRGIVKRLQRRNTKEELARAIQKIYASLDTSERPKDTLEILSDIEKIVRFTLWR